MLKAGSLFYALAITVIMALLSASLLLAAHYTRLRLRRDELKTEVIRNAYSGLELLMSDQSPVQTGGAAQETDLFGRGRDSVLLQKKSWGAFDVLIAAAHNKSLKEVLIAQSGWQATHEDPTALVLADLDRPLSVSGNTRLKGTCYLPKTGIQRAYIEGQSYSGDQLVYGEIKTAERFLPPYNDTLVKRIKDLFLFQPGKEDSLMSYTDFQQSDSTGNSFLNAVLYIYDAGPVIISTQKVNGQVCIISGTSIHVEKNSSVHDALLIAPKILIDDETDASFQAFARDSLFAGKRVRLHYPSVLGIIGTDKSPDFACMQFGEDSKIYGQLFACMLNNDFRKHALISVDKTALVYGEIYSADLLDLKGTVQGDVSCCKFELKTNSAEYENHLLNAVIDRPKRSPDYVGSALARKKTGRKAVVQWLK